MEKRRAVLANIPQIPAQILRDLVNQQRDMAVVGEVRTLGELPAAVAALQGEVVILTFSHRALESRSVRRSENTTPRSPWWGSRSDTIGL